MKKALANIKVAVKLRKSEYHNEWYLIIESYLVLKPGRAEISRVVEAVIRIVIIPVWDKSRTSRTTEKGETYKLKRDVNSISNARAKPNKMLAFMLTTSINTPTQNDFTTQILIG